MHEVFPNVQVIGSDLHTSPPPMLTTCNYVQYSRLSDMQNCFDLILCRHVLEHSYDPVGLVAQLASHLKPGGVLAVEVPSLETKVKSLFGKYWDGYYAPFHTVHFCRDSLAAILERAGLRVFRQGGAEMPKMGRSIQNVLGWEYNVALFAAGILLQPLQIGIGLLTGTSVCLRAWARKPID
jgi:SAM-dependent methyltransferase